MLELGSAQSRCRSSPAPRGTPPRRARRARRNGGRASRGRRRLPRRSRPASPAARGPAAGVADAEDAAAIAHDVGAGRYLGHAGNDTAQSRLAATLKRDRNVSFHCFGFPPAQPGLSPPADGRGLRVHGRGPSRRAASTLVVLDVGAAGATAVARRPGHPPAHCSSRSVVCSPTAGARRGSHRSRRSSALCSLGPEAPLPLAGGGARAAHRVGDIGRAMAGQDPSNEQCSSARPQTSVSVRHEDPLGPWMASTPPQLPRGPPYVNADPSTTLRVTTTRVLNRKFVCNNS